ncbi:MAG: phosphate--AMP phosphotransferase, partial [Oscillospiraceae bacterium]|nr:phosphate--AMP phosphotransferase [Oscillospiraceae bacterium]
MLKKVDATLKLKRNEYKAQIDDLTLKIGDVQRRCKDANIPVMILLEGWSVAGKGSRIRTLIRALDPRGFEVFTIHKPNEDERLRPYMWRFWKRTPANGKIHVFDRSWYRALMRGHDKHEMELVNPIKDVLSFEQTLADSGVLIIKLFLHVTVKEQRRRLKSLADSPETAWRINEDDWVQNCRYDEVLNTFSKMLEDSDHDAAHWTVIEANNGRFADVKIYRTVLEAMERALNAKENPDKNVPKDIKLPVGTNSTSTLSAVNLNRSLERDEYSERLRTAQNEIG